MSAQMAVAAAVGFLIGTVWVCALMALYEIRRHGRRNDR